MRMFVRVFLFIFAVFLCFGAGSVLAEDKGKAKEKGYEDNTGDLLLALPPPLQAFRLYERILKKGDEDAHNKMLTPKSMGLLANKKYPAEQMKAEYERIKNCGRQNLVAEGDRALIVFPDNQNTCFPYLLSNTVDNWRIDLYTMKSIFLVKSGASWTVRSSVKKHPYEFGIRVIKVGETDNEIVFEKEQNSSANQSKQEDYQHIYENIKR